MLWYSVTDWDGLDLTKNYVGLDNYVEVFTEPAHLQRLRREPLLLPRLVRADGDRAVLRHAAELQHPVLELLPRHPVLPLPDQRRRDRVRLPLPLPARRHARQRAVASSGCRSPSSSGSATRTSSTGRSPAPRYGGTPASTSCSSSARSSRSPTSSTRRPSSTARSKWQQFWALIFPGIRRIIGLSLHPRHRRQPQRLRDPVHHDRRRQRLGDVRHPDPADGLQLPAGRASPPPWRSCCW